MTADLIYWRKERLQNYIVLPIQSAVWKKQNELPQLQFGNLTANDISKNRDKSIYLNLLLDPPLGLVTTATVPRIPVRGGTN